MARICGAVADVPAVDLDTGETRAALAELRCSSCGELLVSRDLAGHYKQSVRIAACAPCNLIWFEETQLVRLAAPGLLQLLELVSAARSGGKHWMPRPVALACPMCSTSLRKVDDISRFGRFSRLECSHGHGGYITFAHFLSEKGLFRGYSWADLKPLIEAGQTLSCAHCGGALEMRPQSECAHCRAPVGLVDAARLAQTVDIAQAAAPARAAVVQARGSCEGCGAPTDLVGCVHCPQCGMIPRPALLSKAAEFLQAMQPAVEANYQAQLSSVSLLRLDHLAAVELSQAESADRWNGTFKRYRRVTLWVVCLSVVLVFVLLALFRERP